MRPLPSFSSLWMHYPRGTAASVKAKIGGKVNLPWVTNTCAIRVIYALNKSGHAIPSGPVSTARGGERGRYIYRVLDMVDYLTHTYGKPDLEVEGEAGLGGKRGIIALDCRGAWTDATGHVDIYDGTTCAGNEYWGEARSAQLWICE